MLLFGVNLAVGFVALLGIVTGLAAFFRPRFTIQLQQAFYAKINWRMEPISVPKEIRNTRIMGITALILGILTLAFLIVGYGS